MPDHAACLLRARGVGGHAALLDLLDDAFFVDDESRASGEPDERHQHSVAPRDGFSLVSEDGKLDAKLFGECLVPRAAVDADADHL